MSESDFFSHPCLEWGEGKGKRRKRVFQWSLLMRGPNLRTSIGRENGSVAGGEVKGAGVAGADEDSSASSSRFKKEPFLGLAEEGQGRADLC